MSTLTAASSIADARGSYRANASYAEDNSPAKAAAFITAGTILLSDLPSQGATATERFDFGENLRRIDGQLAIARAWLAANPNSAGGSGVGKGAFGTTSYSTEWLRWPYA